MEIVSNLKAIYHNSRMGNTNSAPAAGQKRKRPNFLYALRTRPAILGPHVHPYPTTLLTQGIGQLTKHSLG